MRAEWVQAPSRQLCVTRCGAACCKGPGSVLLTRAEVSRMAAVVIGSIVLYDEGRDQHRLNFSDHEGDRCPALEWDNTCRMYAVRPQACQSYPSQPDPRCAVWPAKEN